MNDWKVPVQSLIDHIKTAVDVDPWAKEMAEELLKKQEAVQPEHHFARNSTKPYGMEFWYTCGFCGKDIRKSDKFCHECGQAAKWNA